MVEQRLEEWLEDGYARSFRTACLILGNPADAEEAVQEAFLRAWRFRGSLTSVPTINPWLYRGGANSRCSKLRQQMPHRDRRAGDGHFDELAACSPDPAESAQRSE